jgi:colicin import membrane protein
MSVDNSYKWPIAFALMLHVILMAFLFSKMANSDNYALNNTSVNIVNAVVINSNQINVSKINKAIEKLEQESQQQQQKIADQEKSVQHDQALKEQQIEAQRLIAIKKTQDKKSALEKQKQIEATKLKTKHELEQKQAKMHELMQKTMQEQLTNEEQQIATAAASAQFQGKVDKYKAQIIQSIAQYWIVPDNVDSGIYCQLSVHLAPGGEVLSVELIRSSGNVVLDRSAKTAVLKASPLPVPEDPSLFNDFRELLLTVRPSGVVAG